MSKNRFNNKSNEKHSTYLPGAEQFLVKMCELDSVKTFKGGKIKTGIKTQKQITLFSDNSTPSVTCTFFNDRAKQIFYFVPNSQRLEDMFRDLFEHGTEYAKKNGFNFESIPVPNEIQKNKEDKEIKNGNTDLNPGITYFGGLKTDWSDTMREMLILFRNGDTTGAMQYAKALTRNIEEKDENLKLSYNENEKLRKQLTGLKQSSLNEIRIFVQTKLSEYFLKIGNAKKEKSEIEKSLGNTIERRNSLFKESEQLSSNISDLRKELVETAATATSEKLMETAKQIKLKEDKLAKIINKMPNIEDTTASEQYMTQLSVEIAEMEKIRSIMDYFKRIVGSINDFQNADNKEDWWKRQLATPVIELAIKSEQITPAICDTDLQMVLNMLDEISPYFLWLRREDVKILYPGTINTMDKESKNKLSSKILLISANDAKNNEKNLEKYFKKFLIDSYDVKAILAATYLRTLKFIDENSEIQIENIRKFCECVKRLNKRRK